MSFLSMISDQDFKGYPFVLNLLNDLLALMNNDMSRVKLTN